MPDPTWWMGGYARWTPPGTPTDAGTTRDPSVSRGDMRQANREERAGLADAALRAMIASGKYYVDKDGDLYSTGNGEPPLAERLHTEQLLRNRWRYGESRGNLPGVEKTPGYPDPEK